jgi:hypothetical protein
MEGEALRSHDRHAAGVLIAAGALLRVWQYAGGTSLWVDEISLVENVLRRPLGRLLFEPLDFDQVAPPGFLFLVKSAVALLGSSEYALRLFPLLCSLASLGLFAALTRRILVGWSRLFATGLFAIGVPLFLYAAEVKPYSSDVAASLGMTLLAFRLIDGVDARFLRAGLIGFAVVWFSQGAVLVLAGLALALGLIAGTARQHGLWRRLPATLAPWGVGAVAAAALGIRSMTPPVRVYMDRFWSEAFWPIWPRSAEDALWLPRTLRGFWGQSLFQYPLSPLYLALMLVGFWAMWRRRRDAALLLLGPVAVSLAASAARAYPFSARLLLPLAPAFLIAASEGLASVAARLRLPASAAAGVAALPSLLALASNFPVHLHEEAKPVLAYVAARRRPHDSIYVYFGGERAFRYYGPRFGLEPDSAFLGACHRDQPRGYLREIDRFRGRPRVWTIFAHDVPRLQEQALILGYLSRIGVRREGIAVPPGDPYAVTAQLYDLAIPDRLTGATAETYPVPPLDEELARRLGCGSGSRPPSDEGEPDQGPAAARPDRSSR